MASEESGINEGLFGMSDEKDQRKLHGLRF